jgi:hypothetical protein
MNSKSPEYVGVLFLYPYESGYFCWIMKKQLTGLLVWMAACSFSYAQVHISKLIVKSNQKYLFDQTDIVVADTLILEDSATIVLNPLKRENFLHTKVLIVGKHCSIIGSGTHGKKGRTGRPGDSPIGPCKSGGNGTPGTRGLDGTAGINLFLYLDQVTMKESLKIDLHGGDGGEGGMGGEGGSGTSGTVHCNGGSGGFGGAGGNGGNGGEGGTLTIQCPAGLNAMLNKNLSLKIQGGRFGKGGRGGYPGAAGSGPPKRNGKLGVPGHEGTDGQLGKYGKFTIMQN